MRIVRLFALCVLGLAFAYLLSEGAESGGERGGGRQAETPAAAG